MSGLGSFFGLGLMGNALQTFQEAADVTSDNIANVNTPGASRQSADITEMQPIVGSPFASAHFAGTFGNGSIVSEVQRIHDDSYDALFRGASGSNSYFSLQQNQLQALQSSFGEPNNGINSYFTSFQSAFAQLVNQAGTSSSSSRGNVLAAAQALVQALNNGSNTIVQQKNQVIQQATSVVTSVNQIIDQIAALNGQIRASAAVGDKPNTFLDQRDHLVDQLSTYMSTQTSLQSDGSVLITVGGQALVSDTVAYHLANPVIGTGSNGLPALKIDFQSTPPAAANAPGVAFGSGQLAALSDLYNNKLNAYGQQLDNFASSLSSEVNRITGASYDQNGVAGAALFQPVVSTLPVTAANIRVGIANASQLPIALASTAAGSLVTNMNSANNTVDTSAAINASGSLSDPPGAAGITGSLTVAVDGLTQTFNYDTNGSDATIDAFISHFNGRHFGVTASFDATGQRIVFARDPSNIDLVHRAAQAALGAATTPSFTITDSNNTAAAGASLLGALGAAGIQGVTQDSTNAFGSNDNGGANAMVALFNSNVGVPSLQTGSAAAVAAPGTYTIALPAGVTSVRPGDVLTVDATASGGAPQENVVVSAISVNPATGIESFTAAFASAHAANFSISSASVQTLGQYYGSLVSQMGRDTSTAIAGAQSQATLQGNIDKVRQGVDGINLDEETQNLIKYQNAYQAAARTINVLDSLLNTVISTLGVH
jgi:flagellar hook-associated protein 1 FlgK